MESTDSLVLEVLRRASSQNADILKPAETKLLEWETQPGFYTALYVRFCTVFRELWLICIHLAECVIESFHRRKCALDGGFVY